MKIYISAFLLAIILLQSCAVYQNVSVSIDEAYNKGKVKLITTTGKKIMIYNIEKTDTTYYGDLGTYKLRIPADEVEAIYLYDKKESNKRSFIVMGVSVGVLIGIWIIALYTY